MLAIALIGGDGSGKTTIAKRLEQSDQFPVKYLYMGMSAQSSNMALPTSRLVLFIKRRSYRKSMKEIGKTPEKRIPSHIYEYAPTKHGPLWEAARFLNRFAEAWYRQFLSFIYQIRGYIVVYDRHFLFDTAPVDSSNRSRNKKRPNRLLYWLLRHTYPKPDLVIFLDAPAEVLYSRKGESTIEELDKRNRAVLEQGKQLKAFVRIDATQPLEKVYNDISNLIMTRYSVGSDVKGTGEVS